MKRLIPLLLVLAACSTAGGDTTTTTPPQPEPPTPSTMVASTTTTTEPTTTTTEDKCVDRDGDGVLRNLRGFVCPPYMRAFEFVGVNSPAMDIYLPGTYTLRQFTPAVRFTRTDQFRSPGEGSGYVAFDYPTLTGLGRVVHAPGPHEELARFPEMQPFNDPTRKWKTDLTVSHTTVDGNPATITTFTADCPEDAGCEFTLAGSERWGQADGQRTSVVVIDLPGGVFTIVVEVERASLFDAYWTEVAQPILDSIEFLDQ